MSKVKSAVKHINDKNANYVCFDFPSNTYHLYKEKGKDTKSYVYIGGRILPKIWMSQLRVELLNKGWVSNDNCTFIKGKEDEK